MPTENRSRLMKTASKLDLDTSLAEVGAVWIEYLYNQMEYDEIHQ